MRIVSVPDYLVAHGLHPLSWHWSAGQQKQMQPMRKTAASSTTTNPKHKMLQLLISFILKSVETLDGVMIGLPTTLDGRPNP